MALDDRHFHPGTSKSPRQRGSGLSSVMIAANVVIRSSLMARALGENVVAAARSQSAARSWQRVPSALSFP
jgi:hypothetical protein